MTRALPTVALLLLLLLGCSNSEGGRPQATSAPVSAPAPSAPGSSNAPPVITSPGRQLVDEERELVVDLRVSDPDGDPVRVFVLDRPPGARWDEARRRLVFRPDFTQGGDRWTVRIVARDAQLESTASFEIEVRDTIAPPAPQVVAVEQESGYRRLVVDQVTDAFLDSPGYAGRTFRSIVCVPDGATASAQLPVRIMLHGFGGSPWRGSWSGEFRIMPHDPNNTYWWGYAAAQPGGAPTAGRAPAYTQRRVLHLLGWLLDTQPGADPERVYVDGASMGGAGAATLALLHARHFCWAQATYGQTVPRNHRPSRVQQLSSHWGSPQANLDSGDGTGVWDRQDLTRALADSAEARDAFLFLRHGKDDGIIHFGAVTHASPATRLNFYDALQTNRVGHLAVWDEGGHITEDPLLPPSWWQTGWNPVFDVETYLRRDLSFPAFSSSGLDDDPGDGTGNGLRPWNVNSGYAADVGTVADTGWSGQRAGARNRFLRWNATSVVDTVDTWSCELRALDGPGGAPLRAGDPTTGDRRPAGRTATADVTPRRVQAFLLLPGEVVRWTYGALSGTVTAGADGTITVPGLELQSTWIRLELSRL